MGSSKWVIRPLRWVVTVATLLRTSLSTLPMQLQVVLSRGLPGVYSRCVDCAIVHYKFQPTAGPELKHKCAVSLRADADCVYNGTGLAPGSGPSLGFLRKLILPNSRVLKASGMVKRRPRVTTSRRQSPSSFSARPKCLGLLLLV